MIDNVTARFLNQIRDAEWNPASCTTVLAVSGGLDSMAMATLFFQHGFPVVIAHVNYQLRGDDSMADEAFVRNWAKERDLIYENLLVDTYTEADRLRTGIQEAARIIRYQWLEEVRMLHKAQWIATGHHLNDTVETTLFHFIRGCGLRGLHGIPPQNGRVIRPLLGITRSELEEWASAAGLNYRSDQSNASLSYTRNRIRHTVIPPILNVNPDFIRSAGHSIQRFQQAELLVDWAIGYWRSKVVPNIHSPAVRGLPLQALPEDARLRHIILFELLNPLGFSAKQIAAITEDQGRTGAMVASLTHDMQFDRGWILWADKQSAIGERSVEIASIPSTIDTGEGVLSFTEVNEQNTLVNQSPVQSVFVANDDTLTFPLTVRGWAEGDVFHPAGMGGHSKKLKKFFADEKVPRLVKLRTWVVTTADNRIVWVVGMRGDELFSARSGKRGIKMRWAPHLIPPA